MTEARILESVEAVGPRIAALRVLNGMSLEQLAIRSNLTKSYLSKLERGLSQPSIASVLKLSRVRIKFSFSRLFRCGTGTEYCRAIYYAI